MDKVNRMLMLFHSLIQGGKINKVDFAKSNNISERSVDRDIEDIRNYLAEIHAGSEVIFNKAENIYYLTNWNNYKFSSVEAITIFKILLGSKGLRKDEMQGIMRAIRMMIDPMARKETINSVYAEVENYISPVHEKPLLNILEELTAVIQKRLKIDIDYTKKTGNKTYKRISPLIFIFSDFYFYLIAFIDEAEYKYPAFFRVDRINSIKVTDEQYSEELYKTYNAAKMRNCLQFMYTGELLNIKVRCKNQSVEAFKDRLPNNWLIKDEGEFKIYGVKVFGDGFIKWVLSQGTNIEVLEPLILREKILKEVNQINDLYKNKGGVIDGRY